MPIIIRMTRELYEEVLKDLRRPHAHAAERAGFLYGRLAAGPTSLVLMSRYWSVPDDHYIPDMYVGARINGYAIRAAMQGALDKGDGVFHTHLHERPGRPSFSVTDSNELPKFVPAFRVVSRGQPAGLFLLSSDSAIVDVWLPGAERRERACRITIVGQPLQFLGGNV